MNNSAIGECDINFSIVNMDKICRICLSKCENMKSLFSKLMKSEILEADVTSISEVLMKVTSVSIEEDDGLPSMVCDDCNVLLQKAYLFKVQFNHSYDMLQQYLSNSIKLHHHQDDQLETQIDNKFDYSPGVAGGEHSRSEKKVKKQFLVRESSQVISNRGRKLKNKSVNNSESEIQGREFNNHVLHPCPVCTKEFTALKLRAHAHTHKALKKYLNIPERMKLPVGAKFYIKPQSLPSNADLNRKEILHKCVSCNMECNVNTLRIHIQMHRNQNEFKCDQCNRVFKKLNHLNTHRVKHLKEFPYKCDQCGKGFVIKTNYDCHILTHNTNQELPHECNHCLKRFSNPEHLNRHIIIHTENVSYSVKYKVCKCHQCLKTFKDKTSLKSHVCVPVQQAMNTTFPCKTCNKVFKNSSGLYNHNRNIHKFKNSKVLCSVCGNYVSNIYNHMLRHSGEKPFECDQCGKRFIGKPQLRQHLLVHSGLKPFVCSICAKAFNNLYNLQVHERIHKGDRCHICNICNKGFLEKSYLKKHIKVHTKIN